MSNQSYVLPTRNLQKGMQGTAASLAGTGASLGVLRVVCSTDHLVAIVNVACGGKLLSFMTGACWSGSNCVGVALVYLILLLLPDIELESAGAEIDAMIGALIILMGLFGLWKAYRKFNAHRNQNHDRKLSNISESTDGSGDGGSSASKRSFFKPRFNFLLKKFEALQTNQHEGSFMKDCENDHENLTEHDSTSNSCQDTQYGAECSDEFEEIDVTGVLVGGRDLFQGGKEIKTNCSNQSNGIIAATEEDQLQPMREHAAVSSGACARLWSSADFMMAAWCGVFDGLVGGSAILAVIPALSMRRDSAKSAAFLSTLFVASILTMGGMVAIWSSVSRRLHSMAWPQFVVSVIGALASIAFGIVWEVLLSMDKLDLIFG
jgi:hypothetical protein